MTDITAVFFDVGGVLLTNGWDTSCRRAVAQRFDLDWVEFSDRHELVAESFETGKLTLDEYLDRTVFYRERSFTREAFVAAMQSLSQELPGSLELVRQLRDRGVFLATLNNESRELNDYRIATYGLDTIFNTFLSSCYLGVKKPARQIYRMALDITQRSAHEVLFVDDRSLNLECAADFGIPGLLYSSLDQLRHELTGFGLL